MFECTLKVSILKHNVIYNLIMLSVRIRQNFTNYILELLEQFDILSINLHFCLFKELLITIWID